MRSSPWAVRLVLGMGVLVLLVAMVVFFKMYRDLQAENGPADAPTQQQREQSQRPPEKALNP